MNADTKSKKIEPPSSDPHSTTLSNGLTRDIDKKRSANVVMISVEDAHIRALIADGRLHPITETNDQIIIAPEDLARAVETVVEEWTRGRD